MASYTVVYTVSGDPRRVLGQVKRSWINCPIEKDLHPDMSISGLITSSTDCLCIRCQEQEADYHKSLLCESCIEQLMKEGEKDENTILHP